MAKISITCGDSACVDFPNVDLILTDPPYELPGAALSGIINRIDSQHLVLITTMSQLVEFLRAAPEWRLCFDFVFDCVAPKSSKSKLQPNYLHQTGVYLVKGKAKSRFSRFRRPRSDTFESNGYWPTIFRAPRVNRNEFAYGKNPAAIADLLGSFDATSVADPFAGAGSTGVAAIELDMDAYLVEKDKKAFDTMRRIIRFASTVQTEITEQIDK